MKSLLVAICLMTFVGCSDSDKTCSSLRIGMTKAHVEAILGRPDTLRNADAGLYRDVSIYSYRHKPPFSEDDVIYIANRENEVIDISCQGKPIRLRPDGTYADEFHIQRWRVDKAPPANKKVTSPQ